MPDEEIENALYAIHSRLGVIEGKINLVARAERGELLSVLREVVESDPLIGQIYLMLDGSKHQRQILSELEALGTEVSEATVSRRTTMMEDEYGIAELVRGGRTRIYARDRAMEKVLNLSRSIRKWLQDGGHPVPPGNPKKRRS